MGFGQSVLSREGTPSTQSRVKKIQSYAKTKFREEVSKDGQTYMIYVESEGGIFSLELDFNDSTITTLVIVVENEKYCEGVSFNGHALRRTSGSKVSFESPNIRITISGDAIKKAANTFQFINQYRC